MASKYIKGLIFTIHSLKTRLLGRPQPQMYLPVALNQYTWGQQNSY